MVEEEKRRAWCASRRRANALIRDRNGVWYIDPCGAPPLAVNDYRHRLDNLPPTYPLPPISRLHPPPPFSSRRTQQSYQPYLGSSDHSATRKWVILHAITHAVSPLSRSTLSGQSLGWRDERRAESRQNRSHPPARTRTRAFRFIGGSCCWYLHALDHPYDSRRLSWSVSTEKQVL